MPTTAPLPQYSWLEPTVPGAILEMDSPATKPKWLDPGAPGEVLTITPNGLPAWMVPPPVTGIPSSVLQNKGDLISATGPLATARVASGPDRYSLVSDSTSPTGLSWQFRPVDVFWEGPTAPTDPTIELWVNPAEDPSGSGGMANPMSQIGDLIVGLAGGSPSRLGASTDGYVLTLNSGTPAWAASAAGVTYPLLAPDGTPSAPSYAFSGRPDVGLWRSGVNVVLGTETSGAVAVARGGNTQWLFTGADLLPSTDMNANLGSVTARLDTTYTLRQNYTTGVTAPSTPPTGTIVTYGKSGDRKLYQKDDTGLETLLGGMVNPMTASGDLILGLVSGNPSRLPVGTAGQVLTVVSGSPAWAAATGGGMTNPLTTLGDLVVGLASGTPGRLGIGTESQVLTVTSGVPAWAAASGGVSGLTPAAVLFGSATGTIGGEAAFSYTEANENIFFGATVDPSFIGYHLLVWGHSEPPSTTIANAIQLYNSAGGVLGSAVLGIRDSAGVLTLLGGGGFGAGGVGAGVADAFLFREAADTFAMRRTNSFAANTYPPTIRFYNEMSGGAFERGNVGWVSNVFTISTTANVSVLRPIEITSGAALTLGSSGATRWSLAVTTGHFTPVTTATYDIGTSTTLVRDLWLSGQSHIGTNADYTNQASSPTTPAAGHVLVYAKTDKKLYQKDDAGLETALGGGWGGMTNPMTAAADLIVGGVSGAPARLGVGANTQVLTVVSGALAWATPTSGGMTNPMTTLGDIVTGAASGAPSRLGIGTTNQVLTVVGGVPAWAAVSGAPTFTQGSVPFAGASGALTQDNANLFWDNTAKSLQLGDGALAFGASATTPDTFLVREGTPNSLSLRNGTNPQAFRIYNTYTSPTVYERVSFGWAGNAFIINAETVGGTARDISIRSGTWLRLGGGGTDRWMVTGTGFVPITNNGYDCGSTTTRIRNVYIATSLDLSGRLVIGQNTITYSASMTIDAAADTDCVITATNATAFAINAPTNPTTGQHLSIRLRNTSGGALGTATWNAVFKMAAWTQPATATSRTIEFIYDGTNWVEINRTTVDVPN